MLFTYIYIQHEKKYQVCYINSSIIKYMKTRKNYKKMGPSKARSKDVIS